MKALFAGSFDPFTMGHSDIVARGLAIFDEISIGVGYNEHKPGEWTMAQRVEAIREYYKDNLHVSVTAYSGLTVDCARRIGAGVLLRGVRDMSDFEYEKNLADINRQISGLDTVILVSDPKWSSVSCSMVRELLHNGYDVGKYIAGNYPLSGKQ